MTVVIECVRPGHWACDRFVSTELVWSHLLGLALAHGWLPQGATHWHDPQGQKTDYSTANWLGAKMLSQADARAIAQALRTLPLTDALWPVAEQLAAYCDGGGFVFACDEAGRLETAICARP